jgi:hypothetical protein
VALIYALLVPAKGALGISPSALGSRKREREKPV